VAPAEAARLTGVGRTTIYEAIGAGALKSVKIGNRRLITIDALRTLAPISESGRWLGAAE
jgi:excisionase family DNA binding protein